MSLLSFFRRPIVITPVAVRPGDDLILVLRDRLDSDDAFRLLDATKEQFSSVRIHLLAGFGEVQVQRKDCSGCTQACQASRNPPLPIDGPSNTKPSFELPKAREDGYVFAILYVTATRLVAVAIPPKEQSDAVKKAVTHV